MDTNHTPTPPSTWQYLRSEPELWTVGFHDAKGRWHCDSDHADREQAAARVHFLNGGDAALTARVAELEAALAAVYEKYVVDMHGERVCDCDTHVETCAPCLARAVLAKAAA